MAAGMPSDATLAADGDGLVYTPGATARGYLWRSGQLKPLSPGERTPVQPNDRFILCTAGLLHALGDAALAHIVAADEDAPAERLVLAALAANATGAVAAITIEVVAEDVA